jgi:hypothetical protein
VDDDAFNDETFLERDAAEIAADIVREPELFMKMLNSWRDDILTVQHFFESDPVPMPIPRDIVAQIDLPHKKLTIIQRIIYLTMDRCPLVAEFVTLLHDSNRSLDFLLDKLRYWSPFVSDSGIFEPVFEVIDLIASRIRLESMLQPSNESVAPGGKSPRPCYERDHTWLEWSDDGLGHAAIRDRWNKENPDALIDLKKNENGRALVKKLIEKAKAEREIERNRQK